MFTQHFHCLRLGSGTGCWRLGLLQEFNIWNLPSWIMPNLKWPPAVGCTEYVPPAVRTRYVLCYCTQAVPTCTPSQAALSKYYVLVLFPPSTTSTYYGTYYLPFQVYLNLKPEHDRAKLILNMPPEKHTKHCLLENSFLDPLCFVKWWGNITVLLSRERPRPAHGLVKRLHLESWPALQEQGI